MRDLDFVNAGCEPTRGPRAGLVLARRALRRLLRPMLARLSSLIDGLLDRLDAVEGLARHVDGRLDGVRHGLDGTDSRLDGVDRRLADDQRRLDHTDARLDAAEVRLDAAEWRHETAGSRIALEEARHETAERRLDDGERRVAHSEARLDAAERRVDAAEWGLEVSRQKCEGIRTHLEGLTAEYRQSAGEFRARLAQVAPLFPAVSAIGRRQDDLHERIQAVHALHWDHVALARRLAAIEDALAANGTPAPRRQDDEAQSLLPFPGLEDEPRSRAG
jgi:chromosome segregation ATPase